MIIEFCGLPGSGKTSLSMALSQEDANFIKVDFAKKSVRYFFTVKFFLTNFRQSLFWLKLLFKNRTIWLYKLHLLLVSFARQALAESLSKADNYILVDEGLIQRLFTVVDNKLNQKEFLRLFANCSLPDTIVLISGGNFKRFLTENNYFKSPRWLKGEDYLRNWIASFENNFKIFSVILENNPALKIIKVSGSGHGNVADAVSLIKSAIK